MIRTILHADMDAFYAAIEAREDPEIAERPIVVGADPQAGRGRGVVAACNYAARRFGIRSAMPISEAYRRCPHAVYLRPRIKLYSQVSARIMAILEGFTELVERISIDEAFLDVTESKRLFGDGVTIARKLKQEIWEAERLTVSVGVAPNKFLAKLASDLEKPDGLVVVEPGSEAAFLRPLSVERLWGVGEKTARRLHGLGLKTIGDLADSPPALLERRLGQAHGRHLHQLANGVDDRPVHTGGGRKQIGRETTFGIDTTDREFVRTTLLALTEDVSAHLRRKGLAARTIILKIRFAPFDTHTKRRTVSSSLSTTEAIYSIARELLVAVDSGATPIRLIGIGVSGLHEPQDKQLGLFQEDGRDNSAKVAEVLDSFSERFGRNALKRAKLLRREPASDEETPSAERD